MLFREHCKFDTKEESPLHGIDVEENFFTPTMTKYRLEKSKERTVPPVPVFPTASSTTSAKSRLQSYRNTTTTTTANRSNYHPMTSTSSTTATSTTNNTSLLERRISAPLVSPFKSPSLASSPQTELMCN